mmetsp:Transcript_20607/g.18246  ORF Transcript_20607/g.18246 Transcript_20607/m.18246 type:complete len:96 (+) Transcript_20607:3-290(+)
MIDIDLDGSENSSYKSGEESYEFEFDDVRSTTSCQLKFLKKINLSEPSGSGNDTTITITTVFQEKSDGEEQLKKVTRLYSEYIWLNAQLEKSFPG